MVTLLILFCVTKIAEGDWADDIRQELTYNQSEPVLDSDYELIYEDEGDEASEDDSPPLLIQSKTHRPEAGTAARAFYDRLVYIMGNLRDTEYVHSKYRVLDEDQGVYKYDCSGFVGDFILKEVLPQHYKDLDDNAALFHDDSHPRAWGFYDYFKDILGDKIENSNSHWKVFKLYEKIRPGDIIVAKYDEEWRKDMIDLCGHASTGHVMVAWSFPVKSTVNDNEFWIKIIDSSGTGHGKDTRRTTYDGVDDESGIGKGKMWYGYNAGETSEGVVYHRPIYYRWSMVDGCKYTLHNMSTNCTHPRCCNGKKCSDCDKNKCIVDGSYFERLQGIIIARPIFVGDLEN